ncbi:MAG TPA: NUDIX domain-containing protein [Micromonospora sp.]
MRDVLHADTIALLTALRPTTAKAADAREATLRLLADGPVAMTRAHRPGHVTASTLVVAAAGERVLLCLHGKIGRWMQVGGHCEAGDKTLVAAALREATEESGIAGLVVGAVPIDVDVHPVGCHGGSLHHDVRFAAVAPPEAVERVSEESAALGWFAPDALPEPLAHATAELVAPALAWVRRTRSHPAP